MSTAKKADYYSDSCSSTKILIVKKQKILKQ